MFDYTYEEIQNRYEENLQKTQKNFENTINTFECYLRRKISDAIKVNSIKKDQADADSCPYYVISTNFSNYIFNEATGKNYNLTVEHINYWQNTVGKSLNIRVHVKKKTFDNYSIVVVFYANAQDWADDSAEIDFK